MLFDWYFPQFCKSDMSKYGYIEVFQRILRLRDIESQLYMYMCQCVISRAILLLGKSSAFKVTLVKLSERSDNFGKFNQEFL